MASYNHPKKTDTEKSFIDQNYIYSVTPQSCVVKKACFAKHVGKGLEELYRSKDFADVTLVSQNEFSKGHQVILAMNSGYFRKVFQEAPSKHPVVVLKDVDPQTLRRVLEFIYTGKVILETKEDIDNFIKACDNLDVCWNAEKHKALMLGKPKHTRQPLNRDSFMESTQQALTTVIGDGIEFTKHQTPSYAFPWTGQDVTSENN